MTNTKPNPIFRLMPSLADVAFLMPLVFLFTRMGGVESLLGDGDTGWHIRTGEWILAHGRVPYTDMFSYTKAGQPWFAWEWLWDVGAALLHQRWGLEAVLLASMLVICLTFALLYRVVLRRCGNPLVAIGFTILAASGATIHWLARPHLFTMLFTVIFLALLERVREGRVRLLWWMPAITIVWTNLHGGFLVGIVILGAYAGGELLHALVASGREERMAAFRASVPYLATSAGCLAASFVNPYFYHLHVHIVKYLSDPYQLEQIAEFQSANFQKGGANFFEWMLLFGLAAAIWFGLRKRFAEVLLAVGWAHLALISVRNIPIFMLVTAPIGAAALVEWLEAFRRAPVANWMRRLTGLLESAGAEIGPIERLWRVHTVCLAVLVAIAMGMASPAAGPLLKAEYNEKEYPAHALGQLDRPGQRIFASDIWGGYLIYRLAPQGIKVYIDGRSDFYGGKFGQEYIDLMDAKYDWEQTLSQYAVDTVLLPPASPLASTIKESSHWRVVYDDGSAIVFRRAGDAAGPGEQESTSGNGGRGRDLSVTHPINVVSKDHVSQLLKGANSL